ncbi:hypothetical protein NQ317_010589 [Molorchus minor]|uniref:RNA-directed DNA polymerase n=1 Tax=Molorchus minor TaxID=1323400 RepID=A0ABQ9IQD4_9CUCU|nr:hypothetical protein NQ317_010589 [Molorchus minor]
MTDDQEDQFTRLIAKMQETLIQQNRASTPAPNSNIPGSFAKCSSRFDGKKESDITAFIDAIETYKECTNIPDELALKGIPMLLTDLAATWWQGVKTTVEKWDDAVTLLKHTYGPKKPAYRIYRELFSHEQDDKTPTDIFVCQCRALLAQLPKDTLTEETQIDMVYGLLSLRIRKEVSREKITSFSKLLDLARVAEENNFEKFTAKFQKENNNKTRPKCRYCKSFGHLVDDCRRLQNNKGDRAPQKSERVDIVENSASTVNSSKPKNVPNVSCFGCGNPGYVRKDCPKCKLKSENKESSEFYSLDTGDLSFSPRQRPIVNVEICGAKGTGYVDTAAKQSVAGHSLYKLLLERNQAFHKTRLQVTLADGHESEKSVLTTKIDVILQGRTIPTSFIVFPESHNNVTLFGMDFIEDAQLVLNIPQRIWHFADETTWYDLHLEKVAVKQNSLELNLISTLSLRPDEGILLQPEQRAELNMSFETNNHPDLPNWTSRGYIMFSGVLYRYNPEEDYEEAQLVVPMCARKRIMTQYHDEPSAGHYGYERTLQKISKRYYWTGMRKYIRDYVKDCIDCIRYKPSNQKPAGLVKTPLFEILAIDLFGPLPIDSQGYQWILIVEDLATKWIEIFPLKYADAESCARLLIDEIFLRYGTPRRIVSDNGPQFVGNETRDVVEHEQDRRKEYSDKKRRPAPEIQVGDLVWVRTHVLSKSSTGTTSKFVPKRDGPYKIFAKKGSTSYEICRPDESVPLAKYHISDLTPYKVSEGELPTPVFPIRRRGRPPKKSFVHPESSTRTFRRSRGGVCSK